MDKKRFEQILREEGIQKQSAIDKLWDTIGQVESYDDLNEKSIRYAARETLKHFPEDVK